METKRFIYLLIGIVGIIFLIFLLTKIVLDGEMDNFVANGMVSSYFAKNKHVFEEEIVSYYTSDTLLSLHHGQGYNYFDLEIEQFRALLDVTYNNVNSRISNPCQFYSYIWKEYLEYHNVDYKLVTVPGHVFVIGYYENKYILFDQFRVEEVNYV